ncbi:hypothetical protein QBC47DRAFT_199889 [Echria macrotheca]|uniref:SUN domain-containing protein n=1 Tax=Echria macrotheca TaxID=438768 RepID=A0AAJ0BDL0_9PEZI|nr:hypothetical protein QBC47DRAFT_199889 [Echria macrotheca]
MPPRTAARRGRGSTTPSPARNRTSPPVSTIRTSATNPRTTISPLVAKYSTNYGSNLVKLPERGAVGGGTIESAAAEIYKAVQVDNATAERMEKLMEKQTTRPRQGSKEPNRATTGDPVDETDPVDMVVQPQEDANGDQAELSPDMSPNQKRLKRRREEREARHKERQRQEEQDQQRARERRRNDHPQGREEDQEEEVQQPAKVVKRSSKQPRAAAAQKQAAAVEQIQQPDVEMPDVSQKDQGDGNQQDSQKENRQQPSFYQIQKQRAMLEAQQQAKQLRNARKRARDDEEAEAQAEKERVERDARLRQEKAAEAAARAKSMAQPVLPQVPGTPAGTKQTKAPASVRSYLEENDIVREAQILTPSKAQGAPTTVPTDGNVFATSAAVMTGAQPPLDNAPVFPLPPKAMLPPPVPSASGADRAPSARFQKSAGGAPIASRGPKIGRVNKIVVPDPIPVPMPPELRRRSPLGQLPKDKTPDPTVVTDRQGGGQQPAASGPAISAFDILTAKEDPTKADPGTNPGRQRRPSGQPPQRRPVAHEASWLPSFEEIWDKMPSLGDIFKLAAALVLLYAFVVALLETNWSDTAPATGPWESGKVSTGPSVPLDFDFIKEVLRDPEPLTAENRDRLESMIPRMIHVKRRKGKLVIDDEFWVAIRDRILVDSTVLGAKGPSHVSDAQWKEIQQRLAKEGIEPSTKSWDNWLKKNNQRVIKQLSEGVAKEIKGDITSELVSRDDFVKELNKAVAREEFARELNRARDEFAKEMERVSKSEEQSHVEIKHSMDSLSTEVGRLKSQHTAALEQLAKSKFMAPVDAELRSRVNHFAPGNGALVAVSLSSPTYIIPTSRVLHQPQFFSQTIVALSAWDEAGQCWCAGILGSDNFTYPANIAVKLSSFVIPQYVVVEHINPKATVDPGAMPKDMEVWGYYDGPMRETMDTWARLQFPQTYDTESPDRVAQHTVGLGFVKLGEFRYEHSPETDGVQVSKLSQELVSAQAATDFVIVRATTNYGAEDHTCFYRVRMYGDVPGEDVQQERMDWRDAKARVATGKPWYARWRSS